MDSGTSVLPGHITCATGSILDYIDLCIQDQLAAGELYKIAIGAMNEGGASIPRIVDFRMPPEKVTISDMARDSIIYIFF